MVPLHVSQPCLPRLAYEGGLLCYFGGVGAITRLYDAETAGGR